MKKGVLIIILSIVCLTSFSQQTVGTPRFYHVLKIDSSQMRSKNIIRYETIFKTNLSKTNTIHYLVDNFGAYKVKGNTFLWSPKKHQVVKKIKLETGDSFKVSIKFNKNVTSNYKINYLKRYRSELTNAIYSWKARGISGNEVYFVGHRGGLMSHFQENTKDILKYSKEQGVSFMEVDLLISKDDVPFIGHDWERLKQLKLDKSNDSLKISQSRYEDGQKITFIPELIKNHQFLILDLTHNSEDEQMRIIKYLNKNFPEAITKHTYIQIDKLDVFDKLKELNNNILVSFNLRKSNTKNWNRVWIKKNLAPRSIEIGMFVLTPSTSLHSRLSKILGELNKKVIPVVKNDNLHEILRLSSFGYKFIMIDDAIYVDNKLTEHQKKK